LNYRIIFIIIMCQILTKTMLNVGVHAARDFPVHFTTLRIHHQHSGFHPSVLSTYVACSTVLQRHVNPWMTQIGPDLSPKCAYFTSWPKIATLVRPSIYLQGLGPISSIQGFRPYYCFLLPPLAHRSTGSAAIPAPESI
jgi:hypothetical protein